MKNLVFMSAPAAGKGTHAKILSKKYGYKHVSIGDLLRTEIKTGSSLGEEIRTIIKSGKLVPEETVDKILFNFLDTVENNYILDGYPRNLDQASAFEEYAKKNNQDFKVVFLEIEKETAIKRITGRLICTGCGNVYNKFDNLPKTENICDNCGSTIEAREDDTLEGYLIRYETFLINTMPIVDYYKSKGILSSVDASRSVAEVSSDIIEIVGG